MKVLFDNCVDIDFGKALTGHDVTHVIQLGWQSLENGFEVLVTVDKRMRFQQSLKGKQISVVTLNSVRITLPLIKPLAAKLLALLDGLPRG